MPGTDEVLADLEVAAGDERGPVVLGGIDHALLERGVKLAPIRRAGRPSHRLHHVHGDAAVHHADLHALHVGDGGDRLGGGVEVALPGIVVAESPEVGALAQLQHPLADRRVERFPEMVVVAEREGDGEDFHLRQERLQRGGGDLGHGELPVLHLFKTFDLAAQHAAGVDIERRLPAGQLLQPLLHQKHRLVDGMLLVQPVRELQHDLPGRAARTVGADHERADYTCRQHARQDSGEKERDTVFVHTTLRKDGGPCRTRTCDLEIMRLQL